MSVLGTVREIVESSSQSANRGTGEAESKGAYWCNDCGERIRDVDVAGEEPPPCPECGEKMIFERASAGCAC